MSTIDIVVYAVGGLVLLNVIFLAVWIAGVEVSHRRARLRIKRRRRAMRGWVDGRGRLPS